MKTIKSSTQYRASTLGMVMLICFSTGCVATFDTSEHPSAGPIPATALLLDQKPFPSGWQAFPCNSSRCLGAISAWRSFGIVGVPGHVIQDVSRLGNVEAAHAKFQLFRDTEFKKSPPPQVPSTDFLPPDEIAYHSQIADEYHLGCGIDIVPACRAIFRYRNYFVEFFFNVDSGNVDGTIMRGDGLEIREIEPILQAMDERAGSVLGIPLPTRTP